MTSRRRAGVRDPGALLSPAELAAAHAAAAAAPPLTPDQLATLSSVMAPAVRRLASPARAA